MTWNEGRRIETGLGVQKKYHNKSYTNTIRPPNFLRTPAIPYFILSYLLISKVIQLKVTLGYETLPGNPPTNGRENIDSSHSLSLL